MDGFKIIRRLVELSCGERKPYSEARALLDQQSDLVPRRRDFVWSFLVGKPKEWLIKGNEVRSSVAFVCSFSLTWYFPR